MVTEKGMDPEFLDEFRRTIHEAVRELSPMSEEESARRPARGGWSAREIIGHLIDSAGHNHQRFVRAQRTDDLEFPGYDADEWVRSQAYQELPMSHLMTLWVAYNHQLIHILTKMSSDALTRTRVRHNLHEIAWRPVPKDQPTTLDYFVRDYLGHLAHHVAQVTRTIRQG